jgi:hypothetical protein
MNDADAHQLLAAQVEREHQAWRDLVAQVGEDRMTEPGPMGEWSFRDLIVHLLGWRDRTIGRLEAVAAGQPDPPDRWPADLPGGDDDDTINDWIQAQGADRSVAELLATADASYGRLAAALAAIPASVLRDPAGIPWLEGEAAVDVDWLSHYHDEHEASVRAWLASRS